MDKRLIVNILFLIGCTTFFVVIKTAIEMVGYTPEIANIGALLFDLGILVGYIYGSIQGANSRG